MSAQPANPELKTVTALPYTTGQLARGLEAGFRSWRPGILRPLMSTVCDVNALAIKRSLEKQGIPAGLWVTYEEPPEPRTWQYCHVVTVAELISGSVTIDSAHGQFLPRVLGREDIGRDLKQKFGQSGAQCVAFPSEEYREAISETMAAIFGAEADESLMERAQDVYGKLWNNADFEPYEPMPDTRWIADRIMPRMEDVLAMNWHS